MSVCVCVCTYICVLYFWVHHVVAYKNKLMRVTTMHKPVSQIESINQRVKVFFMDNV